MTPFSVNASTDARNEVIESDKSNSKTSLPFSSVVSTAHLS